MVKSGMLAPMLFTDNETGVLNGSNAAFLILL
jgi:hypothetical protein